MLLHVDNGQRWAIRNGRMFCILKRRIKHVFYCKKRGKNVMSINALVHCHLDQLILGGLCRHVLPLNASVVWAGLTKVASSSSCHMTAKTPENTLFRPGFVFYVSKRSKF
jgi:hypothetical protein